MVIPALLLTKSSAAALNWIGLASYPLWVIHWRTISASPLGEEPGWHGYALPKLQCLFGPFRASVVVGLLWAFWHLPLFLVKGWTTSSVPIFVMIVVGWSLIITFGFNLSRENVVAAVLVHSAANAAGSGMLDRFLAATPTRKGVSEELVIALSLLALGGLLTALSRAQLGRPRAKDTCKGLEELPA